jgi:hypothetical protein
MPMNPLESTIGCEQVAVDLTAWLARHEPDPTIMIALDFRGDRRTSRGTRPEPLRAMIR